jgi:hypothetical protein
MDPVSGIAFGIFVAVISTKAAIKSHQKERRSDRLIRANSMLEILSQNGYNLHRLKAICKKHRTRFQTFTDDYLSELYRGKPHRTRKTAKDLIELSGRSKTVYNRVKEVLAMGAETFIARERATELIPLVVEAGYDLAAIQSIANSCEANGWSAIDVEEAVLVLASRDTAMMTIAAEQAVELVVLCVQNGDAAIIVDGVVVENTQGHQIITGEQNASGSDVTRREDREDRREFILTNVVVEPRQTRILKGLSMSSLQNDAICTICLEGHEEKDEICSSRNKLCPHKFHLDCMVSWLMDHDECPVCRAPYLVENNDIFHNCRP